MLRPIYNRCLYFLAVLSFLIASAYTVTAQSTAFAYEGRLTDSVLYPDGNYDFEFRLFDALTNGTQDITPIQRLNVAVTGGAYTVTLDFGAGSFPGADRFLEIAISQVGANEFTTLSPRQQILVTPYAIHSSSTSYADYAINAAYALDALKLDGVAANQFVQTSDPRLTDARAPIAGSSSYIQNSTTLQPSSNFNISGNGTAGGTLASNIVTATTQYNLGVNRVLSSPGSFNLFAGHGSGLVNTTGQRNAFFGYNAGRNNTDGGGNAFFGFEAGWNNTSGESNSYFGRDAGRLGTTGNNNAFFGKDSGQNNTTGGDNAFFGNGAGEDNTTASGNAFFGAFAGGSNTTGSSNSIFGAYANVSSGSLTNATAIGARASVSLSNALVLGQINGVNGATANTNVGIGTTSPQDRLHVNGIIRVISLGAAGSTTLCRNASNQISTCSSSLRYKTDLAPFRQGLSLVNRLNPISFTWKDGGMRDLGLGAEDVAAVEPLLVTRNEKGEVEGVKYDRIAIVLLNAVKEQQSLINSQSQQLKQQQQASLEQQRKLEQQQLQLDALRKLVCQNNPRTDACK